MKQFKEVGITKSFLARASDMLSAATTDAGFPTAVASEYHKMITELNKRMTPQLLQLYGQVCDGFSIQTESGETVTGQSFSKDCAEIKSQALVTLLRLEGCAMC